jgi:integrase/recombinase XerD
MMLLIALYGLRCGEVRELQVTDVDLERGVLTVSRGKNRRAQRFPLNETVTLAVRKYVCEGRPNSNRRGRRVAVGAISSEESKS